MYHPSLDPSPCDHKTQADLHFQMNDALRSDEGLTVRPAKQP